MLRAPRLAPIAIGLCVLGAWFVSKACAAPCCGGERGSGPPLDAQLASEPSPSPAGVPAAPAEVPEAPSGPPDFTDPAWTRVPSRAGTYLVCWRAPAGAVPRNQDFDLEVWVLKGGAPLAEATLSVSGWMPEHGHGLLQRPEVHAQDDGSFRVTGMRLQMRGHWQLVFDVLEGSQSEAAECALEL